jgi:hypothetical protein
MSEARPLFEALQAWFESTLPSVPGRGELACAIRYAATRMKRMSVYLEDGRLELDNNIAERSVRAIAVGKNYLFAGSDAGGESAAVIYTLIETAKLNGAEPQAWLAHVIENIADHPMKKIDDLLPGTSRPAIDDVRRTLSINTPSSSTDAMASCFGCPTNSGPRRDRLPSIRAELASAAVIVCVIVIPSIRRWPRCGHHLPASNSSSCANCSGRPSAEPARASSRAAFVG